MKKRCLLILLTGVILLFASKAICEQSENEIVLKYTYKSPEINDISIEDQSYSRIAVEGLSNLGDVGNPELPVSNAKILIPEGKQVESAEILFGELEIINLDKKVVPVQKAYPFSYKGKIEAILPNEEIYSKNTSFPEEDITFLNTQNSRGYKIAIFNIYPVKYVPQTNEIHFYSNITLKAKLKDGKSSISRIKKRPIESDQKELRILIDNIEDITSLPKKESKGNILLNQEGPFEYVIITNQELLNSAGDYTFQDLVSLREEQGLTGTIVTTDGPNGIYGAYNGDRPSTAIRE